MSTRKLVPIKTGLLRNQVRNRIFQGIMEGRLRPGDPLRELDLARDLRVSQATVCEALRQLAPTGLVVCVPNKETLVTRLTQQELRECQWIRMMVEPEAGGHPAPAYHFEGDRQERSLRTGRVSIKRSNSSRIRTSVREHIQNSYRSWCPIGRTSIPSL